MHYVVVLCKRRDIIQGENMSEEIKKENTDTVSEKENVKEEKEGLKDSEVIDIDKATEEKKTQKPAASSRGLGGKNRPKTTDDFVSKQKKRKKIKKWIVLGIVAVIVILIASFIRNFTKKAKEAIEKLSANNIQTAFVEKKTLYDSKNATGTLFSLDSRTISTILQQSGAGAKIEKVNVEVGDYVHTGDVLVEFSTENIEKSISDMREDIYTQKQQDAIDAEDAERNYLYSYSNAASSLRDAAEKVDRKLTDLHEACDAYGDAKRERDKAKENDDYDKNPNKYDDAVSSAYMKQQDAQKAYDDAVEEQAKAIADNQAGGNSLSSADSSYKKSQITSGMKTKEYQRKLEELNDSLEDYVVYATIDGIVTNVNVSEGNRFQNGDVLTIQDISGYKAEVLVDEYDIPKVKKAYEEAKEKGEELQVVVKTEATGDNEYKGHVTLISPTSTSTATLGSSSANSNASGQASGSSSVNYKVTVVLDETDDAFMVGMSTKVAIVCDKAPDNALCVPYNCIKTTDDGKFIVKVMDENGDKNTADDMKIPGMDDKKKSNKKEEDPNVIVIENNTTGEGKDSGSDSENKNKAKDILSKFGKKDESKPLGRNYREVEVDKLMETDFYAAVVPKNGGVLKDGDEVMIVTEKSSGNDLSAMFGPGF